MAAVKQLTDPAEKMRVTRSILEELPDWFGIEESREQYIKESASLPFWVAEQDGVAIGFLCLSETGRDTAQIHVTGVLQPYHGQGIGTALFRAAYAYAWEKGYSFLQVKTVQMGRYEEYDRTNRFYQAMGFKEFEVFPTLWDEANPCQVYVMAVEAPREDA